MIFSNKEFKVKYPEIMNNLSIETYSDGTFGIFTIPTQHFKVEDLSLLTEELFLYKISENYSDKSLHECFKHPELLERLKSYISQNNETKIDKLVHNLNNKLQPFWTLSELVCLDDEPKERIKEMIIDCATLCEKTKPVIKEIIKNIILQNSNIALTSKDCGYTETQDNK